MPQALKAPKSYWSAHTQQEGYTHVSPVVGPGRAGAATCTCRGTHTHRPVPVNHWQSPMQGGVRPPALALQSDFPGCLQGDPVLLLLGKGSTDSVFGVPRPSAAACPRQGSSPPAPTLSAPTRLGPTYLVASCCSSSICFLSTALASVRATICSLSNCKDFRERGEKTK